MIKIFLMILLKNKRISQKSILITMLFLIPIVVAYTWMPISVTFAQTNTYIGTKLKEIYYQEFGVRITCPSYVYTKDGVEEYWLSTAYIDDKIYVIKYFDETTYEVNDYNLYRRPCGRYTILVVIVDCQNTNIGEFLDILPASLDNVNEVYVNYSNAIGVAPPILEYELTQAYITTNYLASDFDDMPYDSLQLFISGETGLNPADYDIWTLAVFDATDAPKPCFANPSLGFVRMNMFWVPDSPTFDDIDPARLTTMWEYTLFKHEIYHLYGWDHYWTSWHGTASGSPSPSIGFVAPENFGWVDIDNDGIIEILDDNPYRCIRCPYWRWIIEYGSYIIVIIIFTGGIIIIRRRS